MNTAIKFAIKKALNNKYTKIKLVWVRIIKMFLAGNKMDETKNKAAESKIRKKKILSKEIKRKKLLLFYDLRKHTLAQGELWSNN